MSSPVSRELRDDVCVLTIDNPPVNALSAAVWQAIDAAVTEALIAAGADPNGVGRGIGGPLVSAGYANNVAALEALLAAGADPNLFSEEAARAVPPLFAAAYGGSQEAALMLIDAGADTTMRSPDGFAPSDWADTQGHRELAELLRSLGT